LEKPSTRKISWTFPNLYATGPVVKVLVAPADVDMERFPERVRRVDALIDTGSNATLIRQALIPLLGFSQGQSVTLLGAGSEASRSHSYPIQITFYDKELVDAEGDEEEDMQPVTIKSRATAAAEGRLEVQGISCLLGRDVLRNCELYLNGPANTMTLTFPVPAEDVGRFP
jgi:Retroviral aspartyl protease